MAAREFKKHIFGACFSSSPRHACFPSPLPLYLVSYPQIYRHQWCVHLHPLPPLPPFPAGRGCPYRLRAGVFRGLHAADQDLAHGGAGRPAKTHVQEAGRRHPGAEVREQAAGFARPSSQCTPKPRAPTRHPPAPVHKKERESSPVCVPRWSDGDRT